MRSHYLVRAKKKYNYPHLFCFFLNETGLFTIKIKDTYDALEKQELSMLPVFLKQFAKTK